MRVEVNLGLKPLDRQHMEIVRSWRNDHRIWAWTRQYDVISDIEQDAWFERQAQDSRIKMYRIVLSLDGRDETVGVGGFTSIDWRNRRGEFSLYIRPDRQRRGLGRQALKVLFTHGFVNLGLWQIWGETIDGNPARKIFEDLGMKHDGTRRKFYFKDGRWLDAHLVSIFAEEWCDLLQRDFKPSDAPCSGADSLQDPFVGGGDGSAFQGGAAEPRVPSGNEGEAEATSDN